MHSSATFEFLGRADELGWLKAAWTEVRQGRPRLCILRGESGFGKTAIVQAFYSWLSSDPEQDPTGYWPDVLLQEGNNLRLNPPPGDFGAGITPPWLWWGVRWTDPEHRNRGELSSCGLIDALHHLDPHRVALTAGEERLKRTRNVATAAGFAAADIASLGIVSSAKNLFEFIQMYREERSEQAREHLSVEEKQEAALQGQIDALFEFLSGVIEGPRGKSGLPLILVLDDAQWIDGRSLGLVERLLNIASKKNWPLMVIATHWEQDWNLLAQRVEQPSLPRLYNSFTGSALAVELCDIDRLAGLEALLRAALPGLNTEQVKFLCDKADGNPRLMTEIIHELRDEPGYFEQDDNSLALSDEGFAAVGKRSFALQEVQKRRFRKLDQALKTLLGYASYQGMRFLRQLVIDVAGVLDAQRACEDCEDKLAQAIQPYALVAQESAVLYEFRHRVYFDLAQELIELKPKVANQLGTALLQVGDDWLRQGKLKSLAPGEREAFYLLMLDQTKRITPVIAFPSLELRLLADLLVFYGSSGYLTKVREFSVRLAAILPDDGRIATNILSGDTQRMIVEVLMQIGFLAPAERLAAGMIDSCRIDLDRLCETEERYIGQLDLARAKDLLGDVLLKAGRPDDALPLYQQSNATHECLVAEFGSTVDCLLNESATKVANTLLVSSKLNAALTLHQQVLDKVKRKIADFGESLSRLEDLFRCQLNVGGALLRTRQADAALVLYEEALTTSGRIVAKYGAVPPLLRNVTMAQHMVGDVLLAADQPEPARKLYEDSLATCERIVQEWGETAEGLRDVSVSQSRVGKVLRVADQAEPARKFYEASLATCERIVQEFGETAERLRDVSVSQSEVGDVFRAANQAEPARKFYEASLATCERIVQEFGETAERLRDVALSLYRLGVLSESVPDIDAAIRYYCRMEGLLERVATKLGTAQALEELQWIREHRHTLSCENP